LIYLDHNATTPVHPEVRKAMEPFWADQYGNPSSLHQAGRQVARELKQARRDIASFLGASDESEIIFTSGGTESNNAAFRSTLWAARPKRKLVTTAVEHSSILKLAKALQEEGALVDYVNVSQEGDLDLGRLKLALGPDAALVSVMMANNETGVLFPVAEIAKWVRDANILFHVDAVQAVGKIPVLLKDQPIDFLSLSAHKLGGPKGVGVLYVRKGVPFRPFCFGGGQERGRRAGTENVAGIIGLAAACQRIQKQGEEENRKIRRLRDQFEEKVLKKIPNVAINGRQENRLPNTSNLAFKGVDSEVLLILLDEAGICASSGSACVSGAPEPSHVLKAMGFSSERARSSVRFSLGPENTPVEIEETVKAISLLVARLREIDLKDQHPHPSVQ